jgi:RNA polymerase sigma factor (sigma-70 family)
VPDALSDEALLAGLATGQADAAAAFVRRFQARVYGLVITIVRDPGTAEDVAQEAFVRAWRHAGTYDPRRGRVATWLLTIARNAAIDAMRVRRPEPLDPEVVAGRLQQAGDDAPADERDRVRAALAELPEGQRRALFMAAYLGRTSAEIGELEGAPVGTIKTRVRAAMLKLRDALEAGHDV